MLIPSEPDCTCPENTFRRDCPHHGDTDHRWESEPEPAQLYNPPHARLIITHMDNTETEIEFFDGSDACSWTYRDPHGLLVRRRNGRTRFPWPTVKSYTVIPRSRITPSPLPETITESLPDTAHRIAKRIVLMHAYNADITEIIRVVDSLRDDVQADV